MSVASEIQVQKRIILPSWAGGLAGEHGLVAGLILLAILVLAALLGPVIDHASPTSTAYGILSAPSGAHLFGTDDVGRDVLVRVFHAIQLDLLLALVICALAIVAGAIIGLFSGFAGGLVDLTVMRLVDIMMSIPAFILALIMAVVLGNSGQTMVIAIAFAYTPVAVRIVRAQVLALRELPMIETSRAIGTPTSRIVLWHLLPNTYSVLIAQATLFLAWAILDTAAMSFIGVGVHPPTPELGAMISEGSQDIVSGQWWVSIFPGIFIALLVISFSLIGDGLRDYLDPRSRQ
jgi:ABC-type dipeptide/oligopeptide/nickel transport system permease subunit